MSAPALLRVLIIEDNLGDARLIQLMLRDVGGAGKSADIADRLSIGIDRLAVESFDVVLLDLGLPDAQGVAVVVAVREAAPELDALGGPHPRVVRRGRGRPVDLRDRLPRRDRGPIEVL